MAMYVIALCDNRIYTALMPRNASDMETSATETTLGSSPPSTADYVPVAANIAVFLPAARYSGYTGKAVQIRFVPFHSVQALI